MRRKKAAKMDVSVADMDIEEEEDDEDMRISQHKADLNEGEVNKMSANGLEPNSFVSAWKHFIQFEELSYNDLMGMRSDRSTDDDAAVNPGACSDQFLSEFERRASAAKSAGCAYTDNILAFKLLEKCGIKDKADIELFLSSIPPKLLDYHRGTSAIEDRLRDDSADKVAEQAGKAKNVPGGQIFLSLVKSYVESLLLNDDDEDKSRIMDDCQDLNMDENTFLPFLKVEDEDIVDVEVEDTMIANKPQELNLLDIVDSVIEEEKQSAKVDNEPRALIDLLEPKDFLDSYYFNVNEEVVDVKLRPVISCDECHFLTFSKQKMAFHVETRHKQLRCTQCKHIGSDENKLKMHMKTVHGHFIVKCRKCNLNFASWSAFVLHKVQEHVDDEDDNKYECEECDKVYNYFPLYNEHLNMAHKGQSFSCDHCNLVFGFSEHFLAHKKIHKVHQQCKECNKQFRLKKTLMRHRKKVHHVIFRRKHVDQTFKYQCDICKGAFASEENLSVHKRRKHKEPETEDKDELTPAPVARNNSDKHECDICNDKFRTKKILLAHKRVHRKDQVQCDACSRIFPTRASLSYHLRYCTGGGETKSTCEECGKTFSARNYLKTHQRMVHRKVRYLCKECPRVFKSERKLLTHENNVHGENPVDESELCDLCGHRSANKRALWQHKQKIHKHPRRYSCPHCEFTNNDSYKLRIHINVKHEGKLLKCKDCDFEHTSLFHLYQHARNKHRDTNGDIKRPAYQLIKVPESYEEENKLFSCVMCIFKTNKKHMLQQHIETVHDLQVFECDQCDMVFKAEYLLKTHQRKVHERRYSSPCKKCDYVAPHSTALKLHVQMKHEGKTFPCKQCEYVATHPNSLWRHKHLVHNMKRFYCDQCDYMAKDNFTLKIHKEKKHEGIEHVCEECGMKFNTATSLKKHRVTKHPVNNQIGDAKYLLPHMVN